jgi:hypothetical protein
MIPHLLAYIGPETALPAMSVLAAAAGLCLGLGKWLARPIVRGFRSLRGQKPEPVAAETPEAVPEQQG